MVVAGLSALLCTMALIIVLNSFDRRVRSIHQAELALPVRLLASIPSPQRPLSPAEIARVTDLHPQSMCSEAYRFLGLHLLNGTPNDVRSIMVLAAKSEQGSTATLTNLGYTLAQAGKRVMLVDANIRTPEMHTVFDVNNKVGFTDLLKSPDRERLAEAVHKTSNPNLHFITSGAAPKNAWQLFRSENLERLSKLLRENADYILYDTASSLMFTDALNLAPIVDAAILCVRALEPLTGAENRLIDLLEKNDVSVLGSVLCGVPSNVVEGLQSYQDYINELQQPSDAAGERLELVDRALAAPSHDS
jgi:capsular exopolysaccharide synthesis family protein